MHRLLLLFSLSAAIHAADWPQFRGPTADGVTTDPNLPLTWSERENLVWRTELPGPGSSSPVIAGDNIFLTSYSGYGIDVKEPGDMKNLKRHALCLDKKTGKILWNHEIVTDLPNKPYTGTYITTHGYASSSAVTDGKGVFFFMANAGVFAYTVDGKPVWNVSVGEKAHDWGVGSSPILYGDLLIVNAALESNQLIALDRKTGKTVWSATGFPASWNTPAIVKVDGHDELVLNASGKLRAFDPLTGKELWSCNSIKAAELCPSIVAHDGVIFVIGHPGGQSQAVKAGGKGDVSATHLLWQAPKGSNVGSPVYKDGHLYFINDSRGLATCLDAKTGDVVYEQPLVPRPKRDRFYATPLLAGDKMYCVGRETGTYVIAAKPQFELIATNVISNDNSISNASPAVSDGQIFLRSNKYAYCFGNK
ncbi:MAG: PQQ-binding-like beta-propeller repeat protein [Verrucomicrobiaceae bacterium]|jgi:outer membrane protein assembly factor BamB|nr:PQQ-binding-like beta-propeller repeat protein [Verrucomicrobiaceae bacterium]